MRDLLNLQPVCLIVTVMIFGELQGCAAVLRSDVEDFRVEGYDRVRLVHDEQQGWGVVSGPGGVRIRISSKTDLLRVANEEGWHIGSTIFFCNEGVGIRELDRQRSVFPGEEVPKAPLGKTAIEWAPGPDGRFDYSVYVNDPAELVSSNFVNGKRERFGLIDLDNPPSRLCLQVTGRQMPTLNIDSNVMELHVPAPQ